MRRNNKKCRWLLALITALCILVSLTGCVDTGLDTTDDSFSTVDIEPDKARTEAEEKADNPGRESLPDAENQQSEDDSDAAVAPAEFDLSSVGTYSGEPYITVNGNEPYFTADQLTAESYELYSPLDALGRCGVAVASVGQDIMPTEERGSIGPVKPSGWVMAKYDWVDGKYLYNRCHLLGYQLTGENANERNLITGTRSMNVDGMLPFENMVAEYVKETNNHVLYRVTPVFEGSNLVATGVLMEAMSCEDNGAGIRFCVFCYNAEPGVSINYATGESAADGSISSSASSTAGIAEDGKESAVESTQEREDLVWVTKSGKKFHSSDVCSNMKNPTQISIEEAKFKGYTACSKCW